MMEEEKGGGIDGKKQANLIPGKQKRIIHHTRWPGFFFFPSFLFWVRKPGLGEQFLTGGLDKGGKGSDEERRYGRCLGNLALVEM